MEMIPAFYFSPEQLNQLAEKHREDFLTASPFPHIVIDNFIPEEVLNILVDEFPTPDQINWTLWGPGATQNTRNKYVEKLGTSNDVKFGKFTRHFTSQLNSNTFLHFIEKLSGIKDIIPDPSYNGCGLHSTGRGGKLMIHIDTNRHPAKGGRIHQHLNLILFVNKDWNDEYGGHLELWNKNATQCVKKIAPIANRCVIFDTGTQSYHGHPHRLTCPENRRRNSIAIYYYSLDRPLNERYTGLQTDVGWVATEPEDKRPNQIKKTKKLLKKFVPSILNLNNYFLRQIKKKLPQSNSKV